MHGADRTILPGGFHVRPDRRLRQGQAEGTAHQAANSGGLNRAARLGFLAKGLVYALIGVLAIQVAFGDSSGPTRRVRCRRSPTSPAAASSCG